MLLLRELTVEIRQNKYGGTSLVKASDAAVGRDIDEDIKEQWTKWVLKEGTGKGRKENKERVADLSTGNKG